MSQYRTKESKKEALERAFLRPDADRWDKNNNGLHWMQTHGLETLHFYPTTGKYLLDRKYVSPRAANDWLRYHYNNPPCLHEYAHHTAGLDRCALCGSTKVRSFRPEYKNRISFYDAEAVAKEFA